MQVDENIDTTPKNQEKEKDMSVVMSAVSTNAGSLAINRNPKIAFQKNETPRCQNISIRMSGVTLVCRQG
jgi:hypothetical protein